MSVRMHVRRITINEYNEHQRIDLRERQGDRVLTIIIGQFEAISIDRRIKKLPTPRPLTHDLIVKTIQQMGGVLEAVEITDLQDQTYYAVLRISMQEKKLQIDCRPSDAIAVAVTANAPIYVQEHVLQKSQEA